MVPTIYIVFKNYSCYKILEEDIVVKLKSEQMRSEGIRSEHGAWSTELHGCYRRLLLDSSDQRIRLFCDLNLNLDYESVQQIQCPWITHNSL